MYSHPDLLKYIMTALQYNAHSELNVDEAIDKCMMVIT